MVLVSAYGMLLSQWHSNAAPSIPTAPDGCPYPYMPVERVRGQLIRSYRLIKLPSTNIIDVCP